MKICFPVNKNEGMDSRVFGHFGSAPMFVVADTETREIQEEINRDLNHTHGSCSPLKALGGKVYDAIVVGGIGAGALSGLNQAGVKVFQAQGSTIAENLDNLKNGDLTVVDPNLVCGGHRHDHGHGCTP